MPTIDRDTIRRTLALLLAPGQVTEVRAFKARNATRETPWRAPTVSGYYRDADPLARDVGTIDAAAVYIMPNPIRPDLLARAAHRLEWGAKTTTSDDDIQARRWLLVDLDPKRPAGISATDAEHDAALTLARTIARDLWEGDWPKPILADSGNGAHLLFRVDLPNDDSARDLVAGCLEALAFRYSGDAVDVDTTTSNAARIWKLYGTKARKGDSIEGRPHRMARLLAVPEPVEVVPRELLEALAGSVPEEPKREAPRQQPTAARATLDLDAWLADHLPDAKERAGWAKGRRWILPVCPFNAEHSPGKAFVVQFPSGAIDAGCQHNSCTWTWRDLRERQEPEARARREAWEQRQRTRDDGRQGAPADREYLHREGWDGQAPPDDDPPHPSEATSPADPFADTWRNVAEWGDVDGSAWLAADTEPPSPRWLLKRPEYGDDSRPRPVPLFPRGKVGMLTAAGGVGKTTALCELALCVATRRPWLGCLEVATPGRVLLALGEEDAEEAHRRLWKAARILNLTDEQREIASRRVVVLPLAGHPEMALTQEEGPGTSVETPAARALLARLDDDAGEDDEGWALVVLDPASRFAGPDMEKDNAAATRFVQVLERLAGVQGRPSVLVAHHTPKTARGEGKPTAMDARGSSAFSDGVRWQADLRNRPRYEGAPDLVEFTNTKNNYAPRWDGFTLRRGADGALCQAGKDDRDSYAAAKVVGDAKGAAMKAREKTAKAAGEKAAKDGKSDAEIDAAVKGALEGGAGEARSKGDKASGSGSAPPLPEFGA